MLLSKPPENKDSPNGHDKRKKDLIDNLLRNEISIDQLKELRNTINENDLSVIIQRIYDLNEKYILQLSVLDSTLRKLDDLKNSQRNKRFYEKIKNRFRDPDDPRKKNNKIILAEGDSWFNYPIILTDVIDRIAMEKNFAVYSLASGGDWLLNMLTARHYVEELSVLHPDVFLISGGGNDLVGSSRLAAVVQPTPGKEYAKNTWAVELISKARQDIIPLNRQDFMTGVQYLSKDFIALLMFFNLQYFLLITNILKSNKFTGIKIITQGYDYPIPSYYKGGLRIWNWYVPLIRKFFGHGSWLKTPLAMRGIVDPEMQRRILYAMIYLFNEMMIETGRIINYKFPGSVYHVDSRGSVGLKGWTDELHPMPKHFLRTGSVFVDCIRQTNPPAFDHVYLVQKTHPSK